MSDLFYKPSYPINNRAIFAFSQLIPSGGAETDYETYDFPVNGPVLLGLWAVAGQAANGILGLRIKSGGSLIIPRAGEWVRVYGSSAFWADLDTPLEGPPYRITLEAYNPGAANIGLSVAIVTGPMREKDLELKTLETLQDILKEIKRGRK